MVVRPEFLREQFSARFQDHSVVDRYHLRPAYPPEVFTILCELLRDEPRTVLDVGCGSGNVARPLAAYVERIDAVDISWPMLERARTMPDGDLPNIRWLHGRVEEVELQPPYALVTAGESLHWMDWGIVLPRFARILSAHGMLAILHIEEQEVPWREGYKQVVRRFSNNPRYQALDLIAELTRYQLFQKRGERVTAPVPWQQTIDDYIAAQHARSALSLDTMTAAQAEQFAEQLREILLPFSQENKLTMNIVGRIVWGRPLVRQGE